MHFDSHFTINEPFDIKHACQLRLSKNKKVMDLLAKKKQQISLIRDINYVVVF